MTNIMDKEVARILLEGTIRDWIVNQEDLNFQVIGLCVASYFEEKYNMQMTILKTKKFREEKDAYTHFVNLSEEYKQELVDWIVESSIKEQIEKDANGRVMYAAFAGARWVYVINSISYYYNIPISFWDKDIKEGRV